MTSPGERGATDTPADAPTDAELAAQARGRRTKSVLLLGGLVGAALVFLAWTQTWVTVELVDLPAVVADGSTAAPALTALALALAALVGALAIAGVVIRFLLGAVQVLLGVTVVLQAVTVLTDPLGAAASAIATETGVSGAVAATDASDAVAVSGWPVLAIVGGVLIVALGVAVVLTARAWPGSSRKYAGVRLVPADGSRSSIDDWDALSSGADPTDADTDAPDTSSDPAGPTR